MMEYKSNPETIRFINHKAHLIIEPFMLTIRDDGDRSYIDSVEHIDVRRPITSDTGSKWMTLTNPMGNQFITEDGTEVLVLYPDGSYNRYVMVEDGQGA